VAQSVHAEGGKRRVGGRDPLEEELAAAGRGHGAASEGLPEAAGVARKVLLQRGLRVVLSGDGREEEAEEEARVGDEARPRVEVRDGGDDVHGRLESAARSLGHGLPPEGAGGLGGKELHGAAGLDPLRAERVREVRGHAARGKGVEEAEKDVVVDEVAAKGV
jgi:hypothetical protein